MKSSIYLVLVLIMGFNVVKAQKEMISELIATTTSAPTIVIFGGNPYRRDEVIRSLISIGDVNIYGTLSEEEGIEKLKSLPKVDLVMIGGRYSEEQRIRIRKFVKDNLPNTNTTEPGLDYPYDNDEIIKHVKQKLHIGN